MKVSSVRDFRGRSASLMQGGEPVLVTRHGKVAGLFLPLAHPDQMPDDLRRGLLDKISASIWEQLTKQGATEAEIMRDFERFKKRRSRR